MYRHRLLTATPILALAIAASGFAAPGAIDHPTTDSTPAELKIERAHTEIAADPDDFAAYHRLAMAHALRARETADGEQYELAAQALEKARVLAPEHLENERIRAWILLGRHEFAQALEIARGVHSRHPDDLKTRAMIADALIHLGRYDEAEEVVQGLLDYQPGSPIALTRGAHMRELIGDLDGAIDWMREAFVALRPSETEDRAWVLTQLGHLYRLQGDLVAAESVLDSALDIFPEYHYALDQLAKVRTAQQRHVEAAQLRERHCELAPHPENFFYWGASLHRAGELDKSVEVFAKFERLALAESESNDNANHELVHYYLEFDPRPVEALRLAEAEAGRRQDVHTLDLLSRARDEAAGPRPGR